LPRLSVAWDGCAVCSLQCAAYSVQPREHPVLT